MDLGKTGFGDRINRLLTHHADKAGESLNTYARRAIITRLVTELERESSPEVAAVLADARSFEYENIELSDRFDVTSADVPADRRRRPSRRRTSYGHDRQFS
ncbi:hypothetical protein HQO44_12160 [Rhodococcus fascians]|nr:hypothetical protein [Rhodococcus fascians]